MEFEISQSSAAQAVNYVLIGIKVNLVFSTQDISYQANSSDLIVYRQVFKFSDTFEGNAYSNCYQNEVHLLSL